MAERSHWWIERRLISLTLSLTVYLPTYLSSYVSIYLSISLSSYLSLPLSLSFDYSIYLSLSLFHLSICLAVYLSIYLSIYLSLSLSSVYLSSCLPVYLSICLSVCLSTYLSMVHLATYLPIYLSIYVSIYLSIDLSLSLSLSSVSLSSCLPVYLSIYVSIYLSIYLSLSLSSVSLSSTFDFRMCFGDRQFLTLLTSECASRHNGVHFFDILTSKSGPDLVCFVHFDLEMCFAPQRRALFRHLNFQKWAETASFTLLTWKCASRHNGVHFFDISTSKSGPKLRCFVHFDLEMCFAPQRRALFRHLNFQKWSEAEVFCTFWLGNVLRATTACTFSTSQLPKVVRSWGVLDILTWKCASRHNGVHFFDISTPKSGPNLVRFGHFDLEMCFAPQRREIFHLSSGQLAPHPPL